MIGELNASQDIMQSCHRKYNACSAHPKHKYHLCLLESSWESSDVVGQLALVAQELNIGTINQNLSRVLLVHILFTAQRSEAPVLGDDNLLATWELVLGSAESLDSSGTVCEKC